MELSCWSLDTTWLCETFRLTCQGCDKGLGLALLLRPAWHHCRNCLSGTVGQIKPRQGCDTLLSHRGHMEMQLWSCILGKRLGHRTYRRSAGVITALWWNTVRVTDAHIHQCAVLEKLLWCKSCVSRAPSPLPHWDSFSSEPGVIDILIKRQRHFIISSWRFHGGAFVFRRRRNLAVDLTWVSRKWVAEETPWRIMLCRSGGMGLALSLAWHPGRFSEAAPQPYGQCLLRYLSFPGSPEMECQRWSEKCDNIFVDLIYIELWYSVCQTDIGIVRGV